jgi:hypothetical protein
MPKKTTSGSSNSDFGSIEDIHLVADTEHPEYQDGRIDEYGGYGQFTPAPDAPLPGPFPGPFPGPQPRPFPFPFPEPGPGLPGPGLPLPRPNFPAPLPLNTCGVVSGLYRYQPRPRVRLDVPPFGPEPIRPVNLTTVTVRVDVDRFFPQERISIEVSQLIPNTRAHAIAEVTSDVCLGFNRRRITASITYRDGNAAMIPGDTVTFEANRTTGKSYGAWRLTLSGADIRPRSYDLSFVSQYFDQAEFEVDRTSDAAAPTTTMDTAAHPNRPADLPAETISLATVYQRAGFDVTMSPAISTIPNTDSGSNDTWSDGEMHNAMVMYWSRFANNPRWALWVLFARQHDQGRSLGGVMFDDIGPNHRQGTAIFTDSFVQDAPAGDANAAAWRQRMFFWTAVHEMGHAFNLAHAWQKALGTANGAPGDPWMPIPNEPESRSFMNYPFRVAGGQAAFFADFRHRFSDAELLFMRHAPRRFVQMGNSNWFVNHNFFEPSSLTQSGNWQLEIRPNREVSQFTFLEPVKLELKLTNTAGVPQMVEVDMLADGGHIALYVARNEGPARQWQPFVTHCHQSHFDMLAPGKSVYGEHIVSATTSGWLIDEPGFYQVQGAVDMGGDIIVSNILRLHVMAPTSPAESTLAPDYFTEDVGRALAFAGAPALGAASDTLRQVVARVPDNPAAIHAQVAISTPMLLDYKELTGDARSELAIHTTASKIDEARNMQMGALLEEPHAAASTMGHIDYFGAMDHLANALSDAGDDKGAVKVLESAVATMKKRGVLEAVIAKAQRKLDKQS